MTHENIEETIRKLEKELSALKSAYAKHPYDAAATPESFYDNLKNEGMPTSTDHFFEELRSELSTYESVITRGPGPTSITVRKDQKETYYEVTSSKYEDYEWVLHDSRNNTIACLKEANTRWAAKVFAAAIASNIDEKYLFTEDAFPYISASNLASIAQNYLLPKISHLDDIAFPNDAIIIDNEAREAFPLVKEINGDMAIPDRWDSRDRRKDLYKALESAEEE